MIKTFSWLIATVISFFTATSLHANDVLVEAKAALFRPSSDRFRNIYSTDGLYGGEISCQVWRNLFLFGSGSYFHTSGTSIGGKSKTKITFVPLAVGVKQFFTFKTVSLYVGGGVVDAYMHIKDNSPYVIQHTSKWKMGWLAKVGANFNLNTRLFLDLFSEYYFVKVNFHDTDGKKVTRHQADLSGLAIGIGLGIKF